MWYLILGYEEPYIVGICDSWEPVSREIKELGVKYRYFICKLQNLWRHFGEWSVSPVGLLYVMLQRRPIFIPTNLKNVFIDTAQNMNFVVSSFHSSQHSVSVFLKSMVKFTWIYLNLCSTYSTNIFVYKFMFMDVFSIFVTFPFSCFFLFLFLF